MSISLSETNSTPVHTTSSRREGMDAQEFSEIAEKHSGFVYNVAYRMMGNPHDAEEVAQDAFVSAYKARDRFRGDAQPTTWLYRITVNAALMRFRKEKRGKEMTVPEYDRADVASSNWAESPVAATMNTELGERIDAAIDELPEDLKVAVILRDVQGLSNQEAADTLDVSVSALKARLH
ncbi:MAG: RNA polymerase sigma factor, partial [Dehalococcoidia bacterium]